ncbi:Hypothetical protein A7982_07262 [Minicystis rosea]|nr:Hypothetical protein A7982_07262 [Minicystis rosea]
MTAAMLDEAIDHHQHARRARGDGFHGANGKFVVSTSELLSCPRQMMS